MRRLKKKTAKVLAVMMAAAITFTSLPAAGLGPITARAEITGEQTLGENLIKNGDFSEGTANWGSNQNASTIAVTDGKLVLNANGLGADWMPGFFQEGLPLKAGSKYRISFDVQSSIDRSITVGFDAPRMYAQDIELKADESKTVSWDIGALSENEGSANQKLYFYLGMLHGETDYPQPHTISFDNVSIREIIEGESGDIDNSEKTDDDNTDTSKALVFDDLTIETYRSQDDGGWAGDSNVTFSYDGTTATISADDFGRELWGVQWKLSGIESETENNVFAFDVVSTVDKEIGFKNENNGANPVETITLKAGETTHYKCEVAEKTLKATFALYSGGAGSVTFSNMIFGPKTATDPVDPKPEEPKDPAETPEEQYPESILNGTPYGEDAKEKTTKDAENAASSWTLQWSDEFGTGEFTNGKLTGHHVDGPGSELERAAWTYMIGNGSGYSGAGWGNNEKEYYTDKNTLVAVGEDIDGGALVIKAEKESYNGSEYTSARLWTMDDGNLTKDKEALYTKQYGRVEARIKIEPTEGEDATGLWPAFWMMPAYDVYGTWAASGELDIMEARGSNEHSVDGTIHYGSQWPNNKAIGGHHSGEEFTTADWHTYAVEWLPGEIRWYVDDVCYYTTSDWYATANDNATDFTYPAPFDQEFYILLNLAVGGNYDAGALSDNLTEASMYVDYVRVYDLQKEDGTTYTKADYEALESTVSRPTFETPDTPIAGNIGENMVDVSDLTGYKTTTNYPSEDASVRNAQWFVSNLGSGSGKSANTIVDGDTLCINTTTVGANDYDVQLIHNVPLTKGYSYEISFDAKADKAKTISGKFANISGYPAYSDGLSVDLEADWNHYTYTFNMAADSDTDGRIEFTVGGTAGKTYFKNFSIVCTGKTEEAGADDEKAPLANGNHIYNGTFDQGTNRTYFWGTLENTTLTSAKNVCKAVVTGTSAGSGIYQKGLNLLKNDSYRLTMDMSAETACDVIVSVVSADESTVYGTKTFRINGEQETVLEFTMPAEVTDTNGMLKIVTGSNTVTLDNVKMIRTSNNNLDWNGVDLYPLYNGDFFNGDDGWNIWSENAGWQTHSVNANGYMDMEYNVGENADFWCVGVQSSAIKMAEGVPYVITVAYESTKDASIRVETPDGVQTDYDFAKGAHTKTFTITPNKDVSGSFTMYFGNQPTGGNQHFIIQNISVEVDTVNTTIPEAYQAKKPGSVASAGAVKAGKEIVINTNNAKWANAVKTVYVNGKAYDAASYVSVNGTQLVIDSTVMSEEGSYTLKFAAEGYADTKAIAQNVLEASGNVIVNGRFTDNLDGWETYFSSWNQVTGTAESVDGEAVIHIMGTEGNNWDAQLKQAGLKLNAAAYYLLTFDAYASVERPIQMEFANLGTASQTIVNLGTEKQTYYIYFTNVAETEAASVLFMTGNVNGFLSDYAAVGNHDVIIDNVSLCEATLNDIQAVVAPTVTVKNQVVFGNDMVLSYEENTVWENKEISITVDGKEIADKYVAIDKAVNEITIAGEVIGNAGIHAVTVTAEGYKAVKVAVNVIADSNASILPAEWATWIGEGDQGTFTELLADSFTFDFVETIYHEEWKLGMFWTAQAKKENISTVAGKTYVFSFDINMIYDDANVTAARDIVVETNLGQQKVSVPAGESHFDIEYTPGARSDFYVLLMVGGCEKGIAPHMITLSDIALKEKSADSVDQEIPAEAPEAASLNAETTEDGKVTLRWKAVDGESTYGIYAAEKADGNYVLIAETAETSYTIENLAAGNYYFAVAALPADDAHCVSELVKITVTVKEKEEPKPPVTPEKPDDTNQGGNGSSFDQASQSTSTDQTTAISYVVGENIVRNATNTTNAVVSQETGAVEPETVEAEYAKVPETETDTEAKEETGEIAEEEVPLADTAVEETSSLSTIWVVALVIILLCSGAAILGVMLRKKDEIE